MIKFLPDPAIIRPVQEMQKSAAEARNKNRSALCFDYEPSARGSPQPAPAAPKADKAGKAGKAGKVKAGKAKASEVEKPVQKEGCLV